MVEKQTGLWHYGLRLPDELRDPLKEIAANEHRSLHSLILRILEGTVREYNTRMHHINGPAPDPGKEPS